MSRKRRQYNPEYKFKVALEAAKGHENRQRDRSVA